MPGLTVTTGWGKNGVQGYQPYGRTNGLCFIARIIPGDVQAQDSTDLTDENLAIGWFDTAIPSDPVNSGNSFIIRTNGASGGQLCRNGSDGGYQTALEDNFCLDSLKAVPLYLIACLRADGAAYYVASMPNVRELPVAGYPSMRLVHFAAFDRTTSPMYPSIWLRHMLSTAWPTQVLETGVKTVAAWANWYGSAVLADTFVGANAAPSATRTADVGGNWAFSGYADGLLTADGLRPSGVNKNVSASKTLSNPMGVFQMKIKTGASIPDFGAYVSFRESGSNGFYVYWNNTTTYLMKFTGGVDTQVQAFTDTFDAFATNHVVIRDDGARIVMWRDNRKVIDYASTDYASNTKVGVGGASDSGAAYLLIGNVEFHERSMTVPTELQDLVKTISEPAGATTVYTDNFSGGAGDLTGTTTTTGSGTWAATLGAASVLKLNGSGKAYRDTSVSESGAILRTLPWSAPAFADLSVQVTPPGSAYAAGDNARCGIAFWQDANNWIGARLYVDDDQPNAAEIEIRAVVDGGAGWVFRRVNFGTEINHGVTSTLRMTFDGDYLVCYLGTEPVHVYRLSYTYTDHTPWLINRVGLLASYEDRGSTFDTFIAKSV